MWREAHTQGSALLRCDAGAHVVQPCGAPCEQLLQLGGGQQPGVLLAVLLERAWVGCARRPACAR
jgi:hypothetical protein